MTHLADAWILFVAIPLLVATAVGPWLLKRMKDRHEPSRVAIRFPSISRFKRIMPSATLLLRRMVVASRWVTLILLVLALARCQSGRVQRQVNTEAVDIILALDTSGSMRALDLDGTQRIAKRRNRLEVVTEVVRKFVAKRPSDQLGLVVFGSEAFTQCPLTLDHGIVTTFLDQVEIGVAGDATAIGNAIGIAAKRLEDSPAKSKVIILLTDGRQTSGQLSPQKAAQIAKTLGIRIYTIGAGTRGPAPFLVDTILGKQVRMEEVPIDEETLREVASITGGEYFRAEDEHGLEKVYARIDELEKTEIQTKTYMEYEERFAGFVYPAIIMLLLEILLLGTRLRKLP